MLLLSQSLCLGIMVVLIAAVVVPDFRKFLMMQAASLLNQEITDKIMGLEKKISSLQQDVQKLKKDASSFRPTSKVVTKQAVKKGQPEAQPTGDKAPKKIQLDPKRCVKMVKNRDSEGTRQCKGLKFKKGDFCQYHTGANKPQDKKQEPAGKPA